MNDVSDTQTLNRSAPRRGRAAARTRGRRAGPGLSLRSVVARTREATYWVARIWFRGVFYSNSLRGRRPQALTLIPEENWPGSSDRGAGLVEGRFRFLNHTLNAEDAFTEALQAGPAWQAELHGFDWLRDMRAVGTEAARIQARNCVASWIAANPKWHPLTWRPDVLSSRLCNWLTHAEFISAGADAAFASMFLDNTARQVKHLRRVARFMPDGLDRMLVTKARVYAALCLPGGARYAPRLVKMVAAMCERQILPDGGHIERSPRAQLTALRHLIDLRTVLQASNIDVPESLQLAIDRAAPMLRFYRHGDGGLALFNGSNEGEAWLVDVVLTKAESRGKPLSSAPHTGFERFLANRTLVIADSGAPSPVGKGAHAGTLSFEMSVGKQRIVVNCGAYAGRDEQWKLAQRSTAAHSTMIVDDRNSTEIRSDGTIGERPAHVTAERLEADGNAGALGLIHRRRIYVNASGTDVRGEDTLEGTGEHRFAIRFHLHPSVKASLVKDGGSVLLRLPDKSGWRMRCSGGVASLQESIYLGDGHESRRSEQIVISGAASRGAAQVKWALTRLSDN